MGQEVTSAATSQKQVAGLLRHPRLLPATTNLDFGGGRYDLGTQFLAGRGIESRVYDPFNRSMEHNHAVLLAAPYDSVTMANVLNVIAEPAQRLEALRVARIMLKPEGLLLISCYRGTRDEPGPTTRGWQENRPTVTYLHEVRQVFRGAVLEGGVIVVPRAGLEPAFRD